MVKASASNRFLYVFLDEGGNFDFSSHGTTYFTLTSVAMERPFAPLIADFASLRYDLSEQGYPLEYFHASEDKQYIRDKTFEIIMRHKLRMTIDSLIVEKCKCGPSLRPIEKFYPKMLGYLIHYVLRCYRLTDYVAVCIYTDALPVKKKRQAIQKAIKTELAKRLPRTCSYRLEHHDSKSNINLQIADYCNWAIYRKWSSADERSYLLIKDRVRSEFDVFRRGRIHYY